MRIITAKGEYDLPVGFTLEVERSNPFWSEISEKSIPITLPCSPNNLSIIGADPISLCGKPTSKLDVTIIDGSISLLATQIIHSVSDEGISTTFYFYLSRFWDEINDMKLRDALSGHSVPTSSISNLGQQPYIDSNLDFTIFPVVVEIPGVCEKFILNDYAFAFANYPQLYGWNLRTIGDSERVSVPAGYGITIFLKSGALLKIIFGEFGYILKESLLTEALSNIVWLNAVADAAVKEQIQYSHLVPDITVQEFLEVYRTTFDCEFIIDDATGTASVIFYKDTENLPTIDMTKYILKKRAVTLENKFSQIKISTQRNIPGAECEISTLEKFIEKYTTIGALSESNWNSAAIRKRYNCVYRLAEGRFYLINNGVFKEQISSSSFDYDKGGELPYHEISLKQSVVPLIEHDGSLLPFLGSAIHLNTHIKDKEEKEGKDNYSTMWCFAKFASDGRRKSAYGSINNYDNLGHRDGDYSLQVWGEDGLFQKFHAKRDAILRHSHIPTSIEMLIPEHLKTSLPEYCPILIENQLLEVDKISYTLGQQSVKECSFKTLRLYEPCDLTEEQSSPQLIFDHELVTTYRWIRQSNAEEVLAGYHSSHEVDNDISNKDTLPYRPSADPAQADHEEAIAGKRFNLKSCNVEVWTTEYGNYVRSSNDIVDYWWTVLAL